ncbi:hypothetical protein [Burkholderia gladioli]|uniref:hypothetical protein n=1 Tax=Burkholderia gladioli TaxID=28095 RepID=UPI003D1D15B4
MNFTGKNLQLIRSAIEGSIADFRMHIASCPDVNEYADDIEAYEREIHKLERLAARIDRSLAREEAKRV